jgi:hypothetical protein
LVLRVVTIWPSITWRVIDYGPTGEWYILPFKNKRSYMRVKLGQEIWVKILKKSQENRTWRTRQKGKTIRTNWKGRDKRGKTGSTWEGQYKKDKPGSTNQNRHDR